MQDSTAPSFLQPLSHPREGPSAPLRRLQLHPGLLPSSPVLPASLLAVATENLAVPPLVRDHPVTPPSQGQSLCPPPWQDSPSVLGPTHGHMPPTPVPQPGPGACSCLDNAPFGPHALPDSCSSGCLPGSLCIPWPQLVSSARTTSWRQSLQAVSGPAFAAPPARLTLGGGLPLLRAGLTWLGSWGSLPICHA